MSVSCVVGLYYNLHLSLTRFLCLCCYYRFRLWYMSMCVYVYVYAYGNFWPKRSSEATRTISWTRAYTYSTTLLSPRQSKVECKTLQCSYSCFLNPKSGHIEQSNEYKFEWLKRIARFRLVRHIGLANIHSSVFGRWITERIYGF